MTASLKGQPLLPWHDELSESVGIFLFESVITIIGNYTTKLCDKPISMIY